MVELRKRPAPKEAPAPAAKRSASKPRATTKAKSVIEKAKELVTGESSTDATAAASATEAPAEATSTAVDPPPQAEETPAATTAATTTTTSGDAATTPLSTTSSGKTLPASVLETPTLLHDGTESTLSKLLSSSQSGIVIFTYPKASTPGCTTQACLFRDNYDDIRAKGYDVYGLSNDSEKANTGFKTKQNLQYGMLCDPDAKLTGPLGMKKPGAAKGTLRGVVVLGKDGKVEVWFQGGPPKTLEAAKTHLGL